MNSGTAHDGRFSAAATPDPIFEHFGVQLWVPEVGGPIDPGSEAHDLAMTLFGSQSKGERMRIKTRVRAAMCAQTAIQGRFLGGRPPYGYRLVDAGRRHLETVLSAYVMHDNQHRPHRSLDQGHR